MVGDIWIYFDAMSFAARPYKICMGPFSQPSRYWKEEVKKRESE